jgi:hypothetical protein
MAEQNSVLPEKAVFIMPIQSGRVWPKFWLGRQDQGPVIQKIVVAPVFKFFANAWTDLKNVIRSNRDIAEIEQAVDVSPQ